MPRRPRSNSSSSDSGSDSSDSIDNKVTLLVEKDTEEKTLSIASTQIRKSCRNRAATWVAHLSNWRKVDIVAWIELGRFGKGFEVGFGSVQGESFAAFFSPKNISSRTLLKLWHVPPFKCPRKWPSIPLWLGGSTHKTTNLAKISYTMSSRSWGKCSPLSAGRPHGTLFASFQAWCDFSLFWLIFNNFCYMIFAYIFDIFIHIIWSVFTMWDFYFCLFCTGKYSLNSAGNSSSE